MYILYIKCFKIDSRALENIDKKKAGIIRLYVLSEHFRMIKTGKRISTNNTIKGFWLLYNVIFPVLVSLQSCRPSQCPT